LSQLGLPRGFHRRLLEGDAEIQSRLMKDSRGREIVEFTAQLRKALELKENASLQTVFASKRHEQARRIAGAATRQIRPLEEATMLARHYAVWPPTAIPLMFAVMLCVFAFMFFVGGFISDIITVAWASYVSPALRVSLQLAGLEGLPGRVLLWAIDGGILAALSVGVPFVLTFYIVLSILEDTGYLGNVAYITDNVMRKFGLHGRSIIPLIMGFGCNVPAIMATRVLSSRRERLLASTLITLTPCSARIAVVLGAVAYIVGWQYALLIFVIDLGLTGMIGKALNLVMPGESSGLVMEMFPFRMPSFRSTLYKTWFRFKAFVFVAFPIVTVGSLILGGLYEVGLLNVLAETVGPTMYMVVGLPAVAVIALVLGILRKELTLQLLVALATMQYGIGAKNLTAFMTPMQLFVFALIVTLYFPCVATMSVLAKELGWKNTAGIMAGDIGIALAVGAFAFRTVSFL